MTFLQHYFEEQGPGAALAVLTDGAPPRVECFGRADVDRGIPISADTVFDLASASKTLTAALILVLAERGLLELRAPGDEFLPHMATRSKEKRPITLIDLLSHTSGLRDYLEDGMYTPAEQATSQYVLERLPEWSQAACPGLAFAYSNTNYFVLARVAEAVSGKSFAELIEAEFCEPLGLKSTSVSRGEKVGRPQPARGYRNLGYGLPEIAATEELAIDTDGDGGLYSSLNDLARWHELLWRGAIVGESSLRLMRTPGRLDSGEAFEYGLGLQVERRGDREWCGHGGSWTSSTTLLGRYSKERTTILVLSNELMAPVERISQRALTLASSKGT